MDVVVAMATFRRPRLLADLLPQLIAQLDDVSTSATSPAACRIVVVDNDPDASADAVVTAVGDSRIHYVVERQPGISSARNRILDEARDSDVLVLLDDDETPRPGWLRHLLQTYVAEHADAVSGPVHAVFEGGEDPWIAASGSYLEQRRTGLPTGTVLRRAATNNLLLDMARVRELGLRFDTRLGLTGGEDSLFTGELTRAGGRIVWCAEAVVDDIVPTGRNNRRFSLARRFAQSSTNVRVDQMLAGSRRDRVQGCLRWLVVGAGQIAKGAPAAVIGRATENLHVRARGERKVASGLGVLAGCVGLTSTPYARKASRRDR